jgi:hypothetical protein
MLTVASASGDVSSENPGKPCILTVHYLSFLSCSSGAGAADINAFYAKKSTSYDCREDDDIFVFTSTAACTVTLPPNISANDADSRVVLELPRLVLLACCLKQQGRWYTWS